MRLRPPGQLSPQSQHGLLGSEPSFASVGLGDGKSCCVTCFAPLQPGLLECQTVSAVGTYRRGAVVVSSPARLLELRNGPCWKHLLVGNCESGCPFHICHPKGFFKAAVKVFWQRCLAVKQQGSYVTSRDLMSPGISSWAGSG